MKEMKKAFRKVLSCTCLQQHNVQSIIELFSVKPENMDVFVDFIVENPDADENELIQKALEIANYK